MAKSYKLIVRTPLSHAAAVRKAVGDAGAGRIGNYSHCGFAVVGTGRFMPLAGASPHIGAVGQPEEVAEERLEVVVAADVLAAVIAAMRAAHPYEEPGYDVFERVDV